jgi:FkbM family methyltransferase
MKNGLARKVIRLAELLQTFGPAILRYYLTAGGKDTVVSLNLGTLGDVAVRKGDSDVEVLRQVFCKQEYRIAPTLHRENLYNHYQKLLDDNKTPIIIDAGANIGIASVWFANIFPKARIVAIEPDPENCILARRNTHGRGDIQILEAGLAGAPGTVSLQPGKEAWGMQTVRSDEGGVPLVTIGSVLEACGPDARLLLVKIDIEGFEADVFSGDCSWIEETPAVFVEPHDWLFPGRGTSLSMQRAMLDQGMEMLLMGENLAFVRSSDDMARLRGERAKTPAFSNA